MSGDYCAVLSTHTPFIFNSLKSQFNPIKILCGISVLCFFSGSNKVPTFTNLDSGVSLASYS